MRRRPGQSGHTLIEVMIAMAVFTIGALGLIQLMIIGIQGTNSASRITQATALARSKLEELQRVPYVQLTIGTIDEGTLNGNKNVGPAGFPFKPDGSATGAWGSDDGWYARSWTVSLDGAAFKKIEVNVQWRDNLAKVSRSIVIVGGRSEQ